MSPPAYASQPEVVCFHRQLILAGLSHHRDAQLDRVTALSVGSFSVLFSLPPLEM